MIGIILNSVPQENVVRKYIRKFPKSAAGLLILIEDAKAYYKIVSETASRDQGIIAACIYMVCKRECYKHPLFAGTFQFRFRYDLIDVKV